MKSEDRRFTSWLSNKFIPVICVTVSPGCPGDSTIAPVFWFKPEYCNVAPIMESIRLPRNPEMPPEKEGFKCKSYPKWEIKMISLQDIFLFCNECLTDKYHVSLIGRSHANICNDSQVKGNPHCKSSAETCYQTY